MTRLIKPVIREATEVVPREALIVTLYPTRIGLRGKRTRREYSLPLATVYRLAIEAARASRRRRRVSRGLLTTEG